MPRTLLILTLLSSLCACRSVKLDSLVPPEELGARGFLPHMQIELDDSVIGSYPVSSRYAGRAAGSEVVFVPEFDSNLKLSKVKTKTVHRAAVPPGTVRHDRMYQLAGQTIRRHVRALFDPALPESDGMVVARVLHSETTEEGMWALSGLTFGALSLVGFPFLHFEATVEVELQVRDAAGDVVARHHGKGKGSAWSAVWWGYSHVGEPSDSDYPGLDDKLWFVPAGQAATVEALSHALAAAGAQARGSRQDLLAGLALASAE
jgi:hypothetical protein